MSENDGTNIATTSIDVFSWYWNRVTHFFTRSFYTGLGPYILYAISVTAALFFLRTAIIQRAADQAYIASLIGAEIQPQSEVSRSTIVSLIMAKLEDPEAGRYLYCNVRFAGDCKWAQDTWKVAQRLIDTVEEARATTDAAVVDEVVRESLSRRDLHLSDTQMLALKQNIQWRRSGGQQSVASSCGEDDANGKRASTFLMASPVCEGDRTSTSVGILPQQWSENAFKKTPADDWSDQRDYRLWRAPLDAELFDIVMAMSQPQLSHATQDKSDGPVVVASYFLTIDNVIRYWSRYASVTPNDLPPFREWAARPYVYELVKKIDPVGPASTRAYVDFEGNGIVSTSCYPLTIGGNALPHPLQSLARHTDRVVVGFFCFDYGMPVMGICALADHINNGPLARAAVFEIPEPRSDLCSVSASRPGWMSKPELINAVKVASTTVYRQADFKRDVLPLDPYDQGASSTVFMLPAGETSNERQLAIVLDINGIGPLGRIPVSAMLGVAFGMMALGTIVLGTRASKELAASERLLGRLRSLQLAVIQTTGESGGEWISAANDRAEELLDCSLPNFGLADRDSRNFSSIFDESTILQLPSAEITAQTSVMVASDLSCLISGKLTDIQLDRRQGLTTAYFIRLKRERSLTKADGPWSKKWLKVIAGPIFEPRVRLGLFKKAHGRRRSDRDGDTFGVVELVPQEWDTQLNSLAGAKTNTQATNPHG